MLPKADCRKKKGSCEGTAVMWQVVSHGTTGRMIREASKRTSGQPNPEEQARIHIQVKSWYGKVCPVSLGRCKRAEMSKTDQILMLTCML